MFEILTVCTGNICRSPLAALMLRTRLADLDGVVVHSAGTHGLADAAMTDEAVELALARGALRDHAAAHRARFLTEQHLASPDLILAMAREHRRAIAELAPARLRSTFTVREFARLAVTLTDEELTDAADAASMTDAAARLRAATALIARQRGLLPPLPDPADDDVVDPFRRSWKTYELSASQLDPAIDAVERVARLAAVGIAVMPD
ncbi:MULTISPECIES: low molecular weight phosphatase family protein [unclassified Microbacterium]|uniref:arsenate reductase/protein-tyrosine-phosphatase family protein n=1 Tax=unclassified Microbacterium TaxID=2609290 RepID=UPI00214BF876|nr:MULTISPECIES: low molecular weight phosphatase family protein [unclassified Microbacterium]MCR2784965.1 low molecular weight phosphatase family protein [Microbacterium sp. zg.B96]WIM16504.1 low molecular weight phosphatase family protein [Microbacterium sp. zg-B96]